VSVLKQVANKLSTIIRYLVVCAGDIQQIKCDDKSNKSYNRWSRLEV